MRKTKIISTLGPAVEGKMDELIKSGCDVARFNTAHGSVEGHLDMYKEFLEASEKSGKITATMLDIKGPELRVSACSKNFVRVGDTVTIGDDGDIELNHPEVYDVLTPGNRVLIHDGDIVMRVVKIDPIIHAEVLIGGIIGPKMGVNVPGVHLPIEYLQERDKLFLREMKNVDFVAASFVRNARDIVELKSFMKDLNMHSKIIAKIENQEGVDNIEDIIQISDGIMVARGDLGTEIPLENLPRVQKYLLETAIQHGKPGIIATQILESMIRNPHPTRAEISDIANAILDGADALMLSGETAVGKYPIESVRILSRVAEKADSLAEKKSLIELRGTLSESVSNAAVLLAMEIDADALLVLTRSGKTARLVSRHRPSMPILAASPFPEVVHALALHWGVTPYLIESFEYSDEMVRKALNLAEEKGYVKRGDVIVIAGGEPRSVSGTTNFVWVQLVGEVIARGNGFGEKIVHGKICRIPRKCDIVLLSNIDSSEQPENVRGIVVESDTYDPSLLREISRRDISILAGTGTLNVENEEVTLDPKRGIIWK